MLLTPEHGWVGQEFAVSGPVNTLDVVSDFWMRNEWPTLRKDVLALAEEIAALQYVSVPWELGHDLDFVRRTGLADCLGASRLMLAEAGNRGLPARFSMGLGVVPPYSCIHNWIEFLVDDIWVPVDPFMVTALLCWGLLGGTQWNVGRSIGGILYRLADSVVAIAKHNGERMPMSMSTAYLAAG